MKTRILFLTLFCFMLLPFISACGENYSAEETAYINEIELEREELNEFMKNAPNSPFNFESKTEFHPLNYFDIDPDFVFESKLTQYNPKDTVTIIGTKGDEREFVKFGFLEFTYNSETYRLNVYQGEDPDFGVYHSVWFTDKTTGDETYDVGRYLSFELNDNPDHIYTIDFNKAHNPYCAYSPAFTCAIPSKEDHIDLAITAGEKKFHD